MSMGKTKLYVGGLGDRITRYDLEREFERYGHLREAWVARKPPGFGFIEFEDPRDSGDAVREMDGAVIMGMKIRVEYAKKMGREPSKSGNSRYSGGRESPSYTNSARNRDRYHSSPDRYRSRRHSPDEKYSGRTRRRSPSPYKSKRHRSPSEESYDRKKTRKDRSRSRSRSPYEKRGKYSHSRSHSRDRRERYSHSNSRSPIDHKNGDDNSPLMKRRSSDLSD